MARTTGTRNPVKQWEITFPQVGELAAKSTFHECWPPSTYSICCEEEHADGGMHLHLGIIFKKGISKSKLLEWAVDKFPADYKRIHVSGIRSMSHWIDYCNKEDPNSHVCGQIRGAERCTLRDRIKKLAEWTMNEFRTDPDMNEIVDSARERLWLIENGYM